MDREREKLDNILRGIVGRNVYFQPPENLRMQYPCIIYRPSIVRIQHANNMPYTTFKGYELTFVHKDPDSPVVNELLKLQGIRYDRTYVVDNLIHDAFTINYL